MSKIKKYSKSAFKISKDIAKKSIKRRIILATIILVVIIVGVVSVINLTGFAIYVGNGGSSNGYVEYSSLPSTPTLNTISPNPDLDNTISLDWSDSLRLWYYNVWRKVSGGSWSIVKRGATSSSFIDTDVANGLYYYKIESVNNIGDVFSGYKSVQIANPDFPLSSRNAYLEEIIPSVSLSGEISLVWTVESGVVHTDNVFRRIVGGSWGNRIKTFNVVTGGGSYMDTINDFGIYEYKIETVFWEGYDRSYYSNEQSVEVAQSEPPPPPPIPIAPVLNSIIPSTDTDGNIDLSWNSITHATSYDIYKSTGGSFSLLQNVISTSFTDSGLIDGTYRYKIKAKNADGTSGFSNEKSVTVQFPLPVPIAPVLNSITPDPDIDGDIDLSWNQVSGATEYNIYRKISGGSYTRIARISGTSYIDYGLTDGNYYYKVKAINIEGSSLDSNVVSVSISILIPPPPPPPVVIPSVPVLDPFIPNVDIDGIVTLTWTAISGAESYKIYRSKDGGTYEIITTVNTSSYTDIILEDGIYIYKIKASNTAGDSDVSNWEAVQVNTAITTTIPSGINQTTIIVILVVVVIIGISVVVIIQKFSKKTKIN